MAGGTGLEPATAGFGDRYSTIELPTYKTILVYNNLMVLSMIFNIILNFVSLEKNLSKDFSLKKVYNFLLLFHLVLYPLVLRKILA